MLAALPRHMLRVPHHQPDQRDGVRAEARVEEAPPTAHVAHELVVLVGVLDHQRRDVPEHRAAERDACGDDDGFGDAVERDADGDEAREGVVEGMGAARRPVGVRPARSSRRGRRWRRRRRRGARLRPPSSRIPAAASERRPRWTSPSAGGSIASERSSRTELPAGRIERCRSVLERLVAHLGDAVIGERLEQRPRVEAVHVAGAHAARPGALRRRCLRDPVAPQLDAACVPFQKTDFHPRSTTRSQSGSGPTTPRRWSRRSP